MQQLMFIKPGATEWHDAPPPRLDADTDVLVRPVAVATCDLDVAIAQGRFPIEGPFPLGHEFVAEVTDAGDDAGHAPGDLIIVPFQISCGTCPRCRRGLTGSCTSVPMRSMYGLGSIGGDWGGALSDVVRVPYAAYMGVPLPDGIDPVTAASVGDNISDAWRAVVTPLERLPGSSVLIVGGDGATSIGLYAIDLALAAGASSVTYVDHDEARLALAADLGADVDHPGAHRLGPFPITVDVNADSASIALAIRSTEPGGICTSVGVPLQLDVPIPLLEAYGDGLDLHLGRAHARPVIPSVLALIADGRIRPDVVTTIVAPWSDAPAVLADPPTKAVISR